MVAKVDSFGRVVIPKALRDRLGLTPGSDVELKEEGRLLTLRPAQTHARMVEENGLLCIEGVQWMGGPDVVQSIRDDREQRIRKLSGLS